MKILLGTNTFKQYDRQTIAVQSYKKLKNEYPDIIDIVNIQFKDEESTFINHYDLNIKFELERSSFDVTEKPEKKLPFVNDILKVLAKYSEDYFIFTNSDVIINNNLIKYIVNNKPICFACSRLDINHINDLSELKEKIQPVRWEIAGFDTFVFKKGWFLQYQHLFNDYLLGKPEFDHVYAGIMKCYGDNTPLGNQYPPFCFHIHHGLDAVMKDCPERQFNVNTLKTNPFDSLVSRLMFYNLKYNLIRRQPWGAFLQPNQDEITKELEFFKEFNLNRTPSFT
jgi:hypothetical protein